MTTLGVVASTLENKIRVKNGLKINKMKCNRQMQNNACWRKNQLHKYKMGTTFLGAILQTSAWEFLCTMNRRWVNVMLFQKANLKQYCKTREMNSIQFWGDLI